MGREAVKRLAELENVRVRVLMRETAGEKRCAAGFTRRFGERIEIMFGDVRSYDDCLRLTAGVDYLIHMAAVIPPLADHAPELTVETNLGGTKNLIGAVIANGNSAGFIYISSVAIYGNRDEKHPWGRVGDPLMISAFDVYGQSKAAAEFEVLGAGLARWAVLRQSGMLYDGLLTANIRDGLLFHTPWNMPVEWVTAEDSGRLLANIVKKDSDGDAEDFWKRVYDIGGGKETRETGYETFEAGFGLIGGSVESFFRPNWNLTKNFHCMWFSDSDLLEDMFHFRRQSCDDFWRGYAKRHRLYRLGRAVPPGLLRRMLIEPLLKDENAPVRWIREGDKARVQAFFGGEKGVKAMPESWKDVRLVCRSGDYERKKIYDGKSRLRHGFDEEKPDAELDGCDFGQAAEFRGGRCLSEAPKKGEMHVRLRWQCHEGHVFEATPYAVLRAGHWCPQCCLTPFVWRMDAVAEHSPFHAQIWLDTHSAEERFIYRLRDGRAEMTEI